uniref:Gse1 coiled-coil protein n=1 Tax=Bubo bubo TaxID=30461 RepID=A0A8C0FWA1_BUBBB
MSHEPKSPSLGMLSTATRTTATVSPLTPSPLNGSIVPNGSPAASSTLSVQAAPSSSFAAALRKLAKQAEEPRGSSISSESSPVSSPATNHSSPASTPKRGPMGPIIVPPGGHSVPSTPPVVTIAPTKTVNGVWRSEGRQQEAGSRGSSSSGGRERLISEPPLTQEKAGGPTVPSHLLGTPYSFGLPPSSVVQDSRFPPLNLQRPVHHVVPPSAVTEDYLRSFRPYHTAEDLRMSSLPPLSLDPAAAAAYYHPSYLTHHPFPHPAFRMDESYCLSALRSPFYPLPPPSFHALTLQHPFSNSEKLKDSVLPTPKPIQHPLHQPPASHHPVPSLIPNHNVFPLPGSSAATALLIHRTNEEEKWLARQRRLRQEKEDRQSQVSEFRQQVLEQHLDMGRAPSQPEPEHRPEHPRSGSSRHEPSSREPGQHFGGPPPLISPKPQHHPPHALHSHPAPFEPSRQGIPLVKVERVFCPEKLEEGTRKRDALEKYTPGREPGAPEHGGFTHTPFLAELEKSTQSILSQQRPPAAPFAEALGQPGVSPARWDGWGGYVAPPAADPALPLPKEPLVPPLLLDPDKPVGIAVSVPEAQKTVEPGRLDQLRAQELPRAKESAAAPAEKPRLSDGHPGKKALSILSYVRGPLPKDIPVPLSHSMNGKSKPWEPFIAEEFAHQFHESVLQSTQKALQKHKGNGGDGGSRVGNTRVGPLGGGRPPCTHPPNPAGVWHQEKEKKAWWGEEINTLRGRQVLQTQCRRLEAQHYSLSLTAEQLSHSMAELRTQKQKMVSERERLQAELDHLRKCLALPAMQWSRGYFKGYPR